VTNAADVAVLRAFVGRRIVVVAARVTVITPVDVTIVDGAIVDGSGAPQAARLNINRQLPQTDEERVEQIFD
jgi:hypothetical protein